MDNILEKRDKILNNLGILKSHINNLLDELKICKTQGKYSVYIKLYEQIVKKLTYNEEGINRFVKKVRCSYVMPCKFLVTFKEKTGIDEFDKNLAIMNRVIPKIDKKFLKIKSLEQVRIFLNYLHRFQQFTIKMKTSLLYYIEKLKKAQIEAKEQPKMIEQKGGNNFQKIQDSLTDLAGELDSDLSNKLYEILELIETIETQCISGVSAAPMAIKPPALKNCQKEAREYNNWEVNYTYYKKLYIKLNELLATYGKSLEGKEWYNDLKNFFVDDLYPMIEYIDELRSSDRCDTEVLPAYNKLAIIKRNVKNLVNEYEDLRGSVRIYVRFNSRELMDIDRLNKWFRNTQGQGLHVDLENNTITYNKQEDGRIRKVTIPGFYSIYLNDKVPETSNEHIYKNPSNNQEPLKGVFDQLKSGYSNFIFGYGFSGSGKSYTLFGGGENPGVLQLGISDLIAEGSQVELASIFELYGQIINVSGTPSVRISTNIYSYFDSLNMQDRFGNILVRESIKNAYPNLIKSSGSKFDIQDEPVAITNPRQINEILKAITEYRKMRGRIKETPNNPESSRGHLFLTFKVKSNDAGVMNESYLTVIDMGGAEDPFKIINNYFQKMSSTSQIFSTTNPDAGNRYGNNLFWRPPAEYGKNFVTVAKEKNVPPEDFRRSVFSIISEGLFINETINHLTYYLHQKKGVTKLTGNVAPANFLFEQYKPSILFVDPRYDNDIILINHILAFLEQKVTSNTQSKYVMLSLINNSMNKMMYKRSRRSESNTEILEDGRGLIPFLEETLDFSYELLEA